MLRLGHGNCPAQRMGLILGGLLLEERLVDVGDHTTARNRRLNQSVKLLVTTDLVHTIGMSSREEG